MVNSNKKHEEKPKADLKSVATLCLFI